MVQIDRFIIDLVAAVVIDHGKLLADRSGCELLVIQRDAHHVACQVPSARIERIHL